MREEAEGGTRAAAYVSAGLVRAVRGEGEGEDRRVWEECVGVWRRVDGEAVGRVLGIV